MRIISLIPLTKKGKQLIKTHGDRWEVVEVRQQVIFDDRHGPWLLVQPLSEERAPASNMRSSRIETASRWIHEHDDINFKVAP